MAYPILPFSSEWELPTTFKASPNATQYGESGIRQRENLSINPVSKKLPFKVTLGTQTKVALMTSFLQTNLGKAIRIPYTDKLGSSLSDGNLYRYTSVEITYQSPSCSSFSFEGEQVRRLKVI